MAVFTHPQRHHVAVLVRPGLLPIELGIVHRLFGQAQSPEGTSLYEVITCTPEPGEVRTDADITVNVVHGPEALAEADTVVVPAAYERYETPPGERPEWIRGTELSGPLADAIACIRPGTRVASICSGAFVLAAAGLLDGRRATTHWRRAKMLQELYPRVRVEPDVLYTDDGNVLTSAGVASGIDLCLHIIRKDHGSAVANEVARGTVVSPHREGGQAQFIRRPVPEPQSPSTSRARAWALSRLHRPITLRELAAQESMSVRTFTRRFREEVGVSAMQWLAGRRLDQARHLLEETDLPVDRIAAETGFGTAASLRQHMHAALGVSPRAYRATFRGTSEGNAEEVVA